MFSAMVSRNHLATTGRLRSGALMLGTAAHYCGLIVMPVRGNSYCRTGRMTSRGVEIGPDTQDAHSKLIFIPPRRESVIHTLDPVNIGH